MRRALGYGILASASVLSFGYFGSTLTACSGGDNNAGDGGIPTPAAGDAPVTRPDDNTATQARASCTYKRGDMPAATLGASTPLDKDIPITNVIVVMMENHSFDNYFGQLNKAQGRTDVESPDGGETNSIALADGGTQVAPYAHAPHLCTLDTNHEWDGTHLSWADGGMSGFAQQNEGWSANDLPQGADPTLASGARAMFYYDQTDIPFYYALAQNFAIADHYHASVLGPTYVNRMYFWSATSFGLTVNSLPDLSAFPYPPDNESADGGGYQPTEASILDELSERHTNWAIYADAVPSALIVHGIQFTSRWGAAPRFYIKDLMAQLADGTLPEMAFVDPDLQHENSDGQDEHPPADIQIGQKWVNDLVQKVMSSPLWAHTALFITWDEHGGFFDHVPPPPACVPDDKQPLLSATGENTIQAKFDRYGVRVPLIVVSPFAKKGYVGHTTYDHTSILRFIEAKFKVPALTARDANADAMMDLFDFKNPPNLTPPTIPAPTVDQAGLTYCETTYPHDGGI